MSLNEQQKESVINCLSSEELALLSGGIGTGKTDTIVELLLQTVTLFKKVKILWCAPSGLAVDNIAEKVLESGKDINIVRIGHIASVSENVQLRCLDSLMNEAKITEDADDPDDDDKKVRIILNLCPNTIIYEKLTF